MSEKRRWMLQARRIGAYESGAPLYGDSAIARGPSVAPGESIEVVPVAEHDEAIKEWAQSLAEEIQLRESCNRLLGDQAAELVRLREAAQPFAALADDVDLLRHDDDSTAPHRLRAGDLRALRAALGSEEGSER